MSSLRPDLPLAPANRFFGRRTEVARLRELLRANRLVSIVGPGGAGKTRLALEVARISAGVFSNGVFIADLTPLSAPDLVATTVAQVVGLRTEVDRDPVRGLARFLARRRLLLVLDNCEHVIDACHTLAETVTRQCAEIRVLATSREPLGVEGEIIYRVGGLDDEDASELFMDRARTRSDNFGVRDMVTVEQVCHALDNLPLAIELAAARINVLTPAEMLPLLDHRFELLKQVGRSTGVPRHHTLRAAVEWSYASLSAVEQQLFRRLSVFAGPFDLAGANAMGEVDTLDVLSRLIDKSLVETHASDTGSRYRLLETLRGFAAEELQKSGDMELARRRHLDHFLARAESLYVPSETIDGPTRALDSDLDNIRSALEWSLAADPHAGLRLVAATRSVWFRCDFAEGRQWTNLFLERCPEGTQVRARALLTLGDLEGLGDTKRAREVLVEASTLATQLGDTVTAVTADALLGAVAYLEGHAGDFIAEMQACLAACEELGDPRATVRILLLLALGLLTDRRLREEAHVPLARAKRLADELGDRYLQGFAEFATGLYWRWTGKPKRGILNFRRTVSAMRAVGEVAQLSFALFEVARVLADDEPSRAARLAGAAVAMEARVGVRRNSRMERAAEVLRARLELRLGSEHLRLAWQDGQELSIDESVALALEHGASTGIRRGGLSQRELEVADLVSLGMTSAEIGERLHLSRRTVDNHLARIFNKLGVSNRLQLSTWFTSADHVAIE